MQILRSISKDLLNFCTFQTSTDKKKKGKKKKKKKKKQKTKQNDKHTNIRQSLIFGKSYQDNISVACQEGLYRNDLMTTCGTCPVGKEPNSDKTACGKNWRVILRTELTSCQPRNGLTFDDNMLSMLCSLIIDTIYSAA